MAGLQQPRTKSNLQLTVGAVGTEYGKVLEDLDRKVGGLKDAFVACGVERTAVKTEDFRVTVDTEYDENRRDRFIGYRGIPIRWRFAFPSTAPC